MVYDLDSIKRQNPIADVVAKHGVAPRGTVAHFTSQFASPTTSATSPFPRHPNWGGRRPGAPRGNREFILSAATAAVEGPKHGRYSARQKDILRIIESIPELAEPLEKIARRKRRAARQTREGGSLILARILERIGEIVLVSDVAAQEERDSSVSNGTIILNSTEN